MHETSSINLARSSISPADEISFYCRLITSKKHLSRLSSVIFFSATVFTIEVPCLIMLGDSQDFQNGDLCSCCVYSTAGIKLLIESDRSLFSFMHTHSHSHSWRIKRERNYISAITSMHPEKSFCQTNLFIFF